MALFFAVVIVGVIVLCLQQWGNLQNERARLAGEEQQLWAAEARLGALRELEKTRGQLEADLAVLGRLLPGEPREDKLLVDLQAGADLAGMKLMQIRFGQRTAGEGYQEMPFSMLLEATYHELLHFLDYLLVYERALRIAEVRIDQGSGGQGDMLVNIRAGAFYAAE